MAGAIGNEPTTPSFGVVVNVVTHQIRKAENWKSSGLLHGSDACGRGASPDAGLASMDINPSTQ